MMDAHCTPCTVRQNKWTFNDYKLIKVIGAAHDRIAFQRKGKYTRGLSMSTTAFKKMDDVTITPGMEINLEGNIHLRHFGNCVNLIKFCLTSDSKQCEGGFFNFTLEEWTKFWNVLRPKILTFLNE